MTEETADAVDATAEADATVDAQGTEATAEVTADASADVTAEEALTVESFDMEKVAEMIENSDLGAMEKTLLANGLQAAQDNPELLEAFLTRAREALGMPAN
ncbi:hypothetical protein FDT80_01860 [Sulfitobacter sabulilitoris]|uniref:Uncharacterized protein n=1 Tax=Sulfitobacter sabulilitoris TaxID=2562655 RepID=A0A5S3PIY5_9RHOB|nr:hypothetical protein FDT80_01860 [Sulfitobacter sabulilitoris]